MLRLGTRVRMAGQDGLVVARTLAGAPTYDLRLADGRVVKYVDEADFEVVDAGDAPHGPAAAPHHHARPGD